MNRSKTRLVFGGIGGFQCSFILNKLTGNEIELLLVNNDCKANNLR